jgi:hypothetical protein
VLNKNHAELRRRCMSLCDTTVVLLCHRAPRVETYMQLGQENRHSQTAFVVWFQPHDISHTVTFLTSWGCRVENRCTLV